MSGKIYLVTSGSYSDYGVDSVWTTREKADAEVVRLKEADSWCDVPRVEEFWLDRVADLDGVPRVEEFWLDRVADLDGVPVWQVSFRNNETVCERAVGRVRDQGIFIGKHTYQHHGNALFLIRAEDEARAIKVAAERRASLLAAYAGRSEQPGEWVPIDSDH